MFKLFFVLYIFLNYSRLQKTPFADTHTKDLGAFYRECQTAPQLRAFSDESTLAEQIGDLTKQLENFETNMQQYENLLSSLCQTEDSNQ